MKLTAAIAKLREEDPSLSFEQNAELHEMALVGQGEIHLKVAVEKLLSKYGLKLNTQPPAGAVQGNDPQAAPRSAAGTSASPAATASSATW